MNRRPWAVVLVAILQFSSPLIYILVAAIFYRLSFELTVSAIFSLTPRLRLFEIFALPILIGATVMLTRRLGYYAVVLGSSYLLIRGVFEAVTSKVIDPVFPAMISNVACLIMIGILLRPKNKSIYFDPKLRWWESKPRYVTNFPASIIRKNGTPLSATLQNIANGGGGVEANSKTVQVGDLVDIEFQYEGQTYRIKSSVAWTREANGDGSYLGLTWTAENSTDTLNKVASLVRVLKTRDTPTTRNIPSRMSEVKDWFTKLAS